MVFRENLSRHLEFFSRRGGATWVVSGCIFCTGNNSGHILTGGRLCWHFPGASVNPGSSLQAQCHVRARILPQRGFFSLVFPQMARQDSNPRRLGFLGTDGTTESWPQTFRLLRGALTSWADRKGAMAEVLCPCRHHLPKTFLVRLIAKTVG